MGRKINVAVYGLGRIGIVHSANVMMDSRYHLAYLVEIDIPKARKIAGDLRLNHSELTSAEHFKTFNSCEEGMVGIVHPDCIDSMLRDPNLHAVVVCAPTAQHPELILKSLRAGKPVMCEKPISLEIKEVDECYHEAEKLHVPLLCAFNRRFDPNFVRFQTLAQSGTIGTRQLLKTTARDNPIPTVEFLKISGGIFHDCASHDIDMTRWILGEDPVEVFAMASAFMGPVKELNDFDTILISLKFPSGAMSSTDISRKACYGYDQRLEMLGDKGMLQAENMKTSTVVVASEQGYLSDCNAYSFPQRYSQAYKEELSHFADIVFDYQDAKQRGDNELRVKMRVSHQDSRKAAIIAEAAEKSCRTGMPVKIVYN